MKELILGIDLCDDYTQISLFDPETQDAVAVDLSSTEGGNGMMPTVLCRMRGQENWHTGEEVYRYALFGKGVMVNKLVSLLAKAGMATIDGVQYSAEELMEAFLTRILDGVREKTGVDTIASLTFTLQDLDVGVMNTLIDISERLGIPRENIHMMSHTECFVFYVLSQKREVWANQTCLFDLTENGLHYYEMRIIRGRKPQVVEAQHVKLPDGFSLDILDTEAGCKMADAIMCSCADRMMGRKLISSVFLVGRGFDRSDWATEFIRKVCAKRRAFVGQQLFARGAAYGAMDFLRETSAYPFVFLCEGRLRYQVSVRAMTDGVEQQVVLVPWGSNWYDARVSAEFIINDAHSVDFQVARTDRAQVSSLSVPLDDFPARPNKTTKIEVILSFPDLDRMEVSVLDKGFGEFFSPSYTMVRREFTL